MVDLGQKKANARLPFFMPKSQRGGERLISSFQIIIACCEPFLFSPAARLPFFMPQIFGVASKKKHPLLSDCCCEPFGPPYCASLPTHDQIFGLASSKSINSDF